MCKFKNIIKCNALINVLNWAPLYQGEAARELRAQAAAAEACRAAETAAAAAERLQQQRLEQEDDHALMVLQCDTINHLRSVKKYIVLKLLHNTLLDFNVYQMSWVRRQRSRGHRIREETKVITIILSIHIFIQH